MFVLIFGLLLFVPPQYLKYFGLDSWAIHGRPYWAVGMLMSSFLFIVSMGEQFGKPWLAQRRTIHTLEQYLVTLGRDEVAILSRYADTGTKTQYFHPANGAVNNLVQHRILYQSAGIYSKLKGLAYSLTPQAIPYILDRKRFQKLLLNKEGLVTRTPNSN